MSKNTGGPAFPAEELDDDQSVSQNRIVVKEMHLGMTLRDYFAAKAMLCKFGPQGSSLSVTECAEFAYQYADAMIAERNK